MVEREWDSQAECGMFFQAIGPYDRLCLKLVNDYTWPI